MVETKMAIEIVKKAGDAAMEYYENPGVSTKEDDSPVTKADLASEKVLLNELAKLGDFGFLSEETIDDKRRLEKEYVWIIDPLDGTADFIQKTGEFSVMVGLARNGKPVLGIVYLPVADVVYFGKKGEGSFVTVGKIKPKKLQVSEVTATERSRLVVSCNHLSHKDDVIVKKMSLGSCLKVGSNGVKMGLIAEGKAEFFFNSWTGFGEWDSCAPELILTEAGGLVTGTDGRRLAYNKQTPICEKGIVASNGFLHAEIIGMFGKNKEK